MSGHSKWHNIQGRKNAQDAKRGKIFQKISRDLYQAAKAGDPDPANNAQLRLVIDKAHAANMPKKILTVLLLKLQVLVELSSKKLLMKVMDQVG